MDIDYSQSVTEIALQIFRRPDGLAMSVFTATFLLSVLLGGGGTVKLSGGEQNDILCKNVVAN